MPERKVQVGIIDSEEDCMNLMAIVIGEAGYTTVTRLFSEVKKDPLGFKKFLTEFNPEVLVIEVPVRYLQNWSVVKNWLTIDEMKEKASILTTTDTAWKKDFVGKPATVECLSRPFDNDTLIKVVSQKYRSVANRQKRAQA